MSLAARRAKARVQEAEGLNKAPTPAATKIVIGAKKNGGGWARLKALQSSGAVHSPSSEEAPVLVSPTAKDLPLGGGGVDQRSVAIFAAAHK